MDKKKGRPQWQIKAENMRDEDEEKGVHCAGCKKRKDRVRFSNVQWNLYKQRKYQARSRNKNDEDVEKPFCRQCNGEPATEKKCVGCEKELPLDKFSKNARKNRDNAKCINCTQNWEDLEADPHNAIKEQEIYDNLVESGGTSTWSTRALGSALPSEISSRPGRGYDTASVTGTNPRSEASGVWIREEDNHRASYRSPASDSGSDITTDTKRTFSHADTTPTNGTWAGFKPIEQGFRNRQTSTTGTNNTGFAKQGAYRENMETRVTQKWQNDKAKAAEAEEDDDDDDDDDDDEDNDSDFEL